MIWPRELIEFLQLRQYAGRANETPVVRPALPDTLRKRLIGLHAACRYAAVLVESDCFTARVLSSASTSSPPASTPSKASRAIACGVAFGPSMPWVRSVST